MNAKILVIDDEQGVLDSIGEVLDDENFQYKLLSDDRIILQVVSDYRPDLILLDVSLSNADGRDVCNELKSDKSTQDIPIIMISGSHDLASALRTNSSPNDFIEKPLDMRILVSKIKDNLFNSEERLAG